MSSPNSPWKIFAAAVVFLAVFSAFVFALGQTLPELLSLGKPGAALPAKPAREPFATLPAVPKPAFQLGDKTNNAIAPGTLGLSLPVPVNHRAVHVALLGDLANDPETFATAVGELKLLRPDLVFALGNPITAAHRSAEDYARQVKDYFAAIAPLEAAVYPVAGENEVSPGVADAADRRFEGLYQHYFGPLYYSVDLQAAHFIVLDSEERGVPDGVQGISAAQLAWLQNDLNRAFDNVRIAHVIVLLHRPLWRENAHWGEVHAALVAFNHRPVVTVEGMSGTQRMAPRVEAVFAANLGTISKEADRDGIAYQVIGPTGGAIAQDKRTGAMNTYTLVTVDAAGTRIAQIEPGFVHAADAVVAADRDKAAALAQLSEAELGIDGFVDQPNGHDVEVKREDQKLKMTLTNPLDVPIDITLRLAAPGVHSLWELDQPQSNYHLEARGHVTYALGLKAAAQSADVLPPQVEFAASFLDSKGRSVPVLIRRSVPLVPAFTLPLLVHGGPPAAADWEGAYHTHAFAQATEGGEKQTSNPVIDLLADEANIYLRVAVDDTTPSYVADFDDPQQLPSDAVAISFAPMPAPSKYPPDQIQRIVILPFAPGAPLLLTNGGPAQKQAPLQILDTAAHQVMAKMRPIDGGYTLEITLPRKTLCPDASAFLMNITVNDNDHSPVSASRSLASEAHAPLTWAHVQFQIPATQPAPATQGQQ